MKIKKTNLELVNFINVATSFMKDANTKDTKLATLVKKQAKRISKDLEVYQEEIEGLRIDNCSVDEKNNIIRNAEGGYVYTRDALKKFKKAVKILDEKEVEFDIYLTAESLESCHDAYKEYFLDFIAVNVEVEQE